MPLPPSERLFSDIFTRDHNYFVANLKEMEVDPSNIDAEDPSASATLRYQAKKSNVDLTSLFVFYLLFGF